MILYAYLTTLSLGAYVYFNFSKMMNLLITQIAQVAIPNDFRSVQLFYLLQKICFRLESY